MFEFVLLMDTIIFFVRSSFALSPSSFGQFLINSTASKKCSIYGMFELRESFSPREFNYEIRLNYILDPFQPFWVLIAFLDRP